MHWIALQLAGLWVSSAEGKTQPFDINAPSQESFKCPPRSVFAKHADPIFLPWGCHSQPCPRDLTVRARGHVWDLLNLPAGNRSGHFGLARLALEQRHDCSKQAQISLLHSARMATEYGMMKEKGQSTSQQYDVDLLASLARRLDHKLEAAVYGRRGNPEMLAPPLRLDPEMVNVIVIIGDDFVHHARPTLVSLLVHRSCGIRLFVLSDTKGHEAVEAMLKTFPPQLLEATEIQYTQLGLDDPSSRFYKALEGCNCKPQTVETGATATDEVIIRAAGATILPHEILPDSIDKAIHIDIGDVLVLGDIYDLWNHFDQFNEDHLFALAVESGHWLFSGGAEYSSTESLRLPNSGPGQPWHANKTINPAVSLYRLDRMRTRGHTQKLQAVQCRVQAGQLQPHIVVDKFVRMNPETWLELPSRWHYMPSMYWVPDFTPGFPGLISPHELRHPRPSALESAAESRLIHENVYERSAHQEYRLNNTEKRYFSWTTTPKQQVMLLHATCSYKKEKWVQRLFRYWGKPPPKNYRGLEGGLTDEIPYLFGVAVRSKNK